MSKLINEVIYPTTHRPGNANGVTVEVKIVDVQKFNLFDLLMLQRTKIQETPKAELPKHLQYLKSEIQSELPTATPFIDIAITRLNTGSILVDISTAAVFENYNQELAYNLLDSKITSEVATVGAFLSKNNNDTQHRQMQLNPIVDNANRDDLRLDTTSAIGWNFPIQINTIDINFTLGFVDVPQAVVAIGTLENGHVEFGEAQGIVVNGYEHEYVDLEHLAKVRMYDRVNRLRGEVARYNAMQSK